MNLGHKAYKLQKKARISDDEMGTLRAYLSEGRDKRYLPKIGKFLDAEGNLQEGKVKTAVEAWSAAFDEAHSSIKAYNFEANYVDTYMPITQLNRMDLLDNVGEMVANIGQYVRKMPQELRRWDTNSLKKEFPNLADQEATNVIEQIKKLAQLSKRQSGKSGLSWDSLIALQKATKKTKTHQRMGHNISAIFARDEKAKLPDEFREFNIRQAFSNYLNSSVKGAVMAEPMRAAQAQAEAFNIAGLSETGKWWDTLITDLNGGTRNSAKQWIGEKIAQAEYRLHRGMKSDNFIEAFGYKTAKTATDLFGAWQATIYPAYLGLNIRSHLRNLGQNLMVTAPEIGGLYGQTLVAKAFVKNPMKYSTRLISDGLLAKGATAEAIAPGKGPGMKTITKVSDSVMSSYVASDKANRIWTYAVGQEMAKDLAGGVEEAYTALKKLGGPIKSELQAAGITTLEDFKERTDELGDILGKYLIGKTQFHYGAEQKAEFLRTLGPFFSMFTKWPVAVSSDMVNILQENPKLKDKVFRLYEKYGAPFSAMALAGYMVGKDNETVNWLVGDPKQWAPALSATEVGLFNNPLFDTAAGASEFAKAVISLTEEDGEGITPTVKKGLEKALTSTVPGVSSIINEVNRIKKSRGESKLSTDIVNELLGE